MSRRLIVVWMLVVFALPYWLDAAEDFSGDRSGQGKKTIRFVHHQLQAGLRESFDAVARQYMEIHPDVVIEQIAIPEVMYRVWLETKMAGKMLPDLVQFPISVSLPEERIVRNFIPLTDYLSAPNPYNRDTELQAMTWRSTFSDNLGSLGSFNPNLLNYFAVPTTIFTNRVYVNLDLLKRVTGRTSPPETFEEFLSACDRLSTYATGEKQVLHGIAGYGQSPLLLEIFGSQTQILTKEVESTNRRELTDQDMLAGYARGRWDLHHPEIRAALKITRVIVQQMQPGAFQSKQEDALFSFLQGKSLFLPGSVSEYSSVVSQAAFRVSVFRFPLPDKNNAEYGGNSLGKLTEASNGGAVVFGLNRESEHLETALDFLRYLTSRPGSEAFATASGWLSPIRGIQPRESMRPFLPVMEGYPRGFTLALGPETSRVVTQNYHALLRSEDAFITAIDSLYARAVMDDLAMAVRQTINNSRVFDTVLAAEWQLAEPNHDGGERISKLWEVQNYQEEAAYRRGFHLRLKQSGQSSR